MSNDTLLVSSSPYVADSLSIIQRIKAEIHRARDSDDAAIKREVISAIRHYRGERFFFNEGTFRVMTVASQAEYGKESEPGLEDGYPADIIRPDRLRIQIDNSIYIMTKRTLEYIRARDSTSTTTGHPGDWTFYAEKLVVYPKPNTSDWIMLGDYVRDIGTPYYNYSGGTWSFFDENDTNWDETWTSPWLEHGEELIRARAKWGLYSNVYLDQEKAMVAKALEAEALRALKQKSEHFSIVTDAVPWGY